MNEKNKWKNTKKKEKIIWKKIRRIEENSRIGKYGKEGSYKEHFRFTTVQLYSTVQ